MIDGARKKTDVMLKKLERRIRNVYATDPSLIRIQKRYDNYMAYIDSVTKSDYRAYMKATNDNDRMVLKNVYTGKIKALTVYSDEFKALTNEFTFALAVANQRALDEINAEMPEIYMVNYNQAVTDCEEAGIMVNGKEKEKE